MPDDDGEFAQEDKPDKRYIFVLNTPVDYALCKERHEQLEQAANEKRKENNGELPFVAAGVVPEEMHGVPLACIFVISVFQLF